MPHAIEVERLSKEYRIGERRHGAMLREVVMHRLRHLRSSPTRTGESIWALRDVSFTVDEEEIVGIVGRNGAGKTTLLKLLSKITYPTSGRVSTRGRVASLVEVGTGFHEELTGRENIFLNGSILGLRKREIERHFDAIVDFAGVEQFVDTPIKRYSSGMRLRLGFAVAAHLSPDILLVDEVLAVGDAEFQRKCLRVLDDVRVSGRTVLFVSHNLEAVGQLCPRSLWIDAGRIRQDGATREVIAAYLETASDVSATSLDLSTIERRTGTAEAQFTSLEYLDADLRPKGLVSSGDAVTFRLRFEVDRELRGPHFGVLIFTDLGTLVAHINTWTCGVDIPALRPGAGAVDLRIDALNLMPGKYYLSFWIQRQGDGMPVDLLEQCAVLAVDSLGSDGRRTLERRAGLVLFPSDWKLLE